MFDLFRMMYLMSYVLADELDVHQNDEEWGNQCDHTKVPEKRLRFSCYCGEWKEDVRHGYGYYNLFDRNFNKRRITTMGNYKDGERHGLFKFKEYG